MGKGDKKTKRGKIIMGSYGVRRPRKSGPQIQDDHAKAPLKKKKTAEKEEKEPKPPTAKKPAKKTTAKKAAVKNEDEGNPVAKKTTPDSKEKEA